MKRPLPPLAISLFLLNPVFAAVSITWTGDAADGNNIAGRNAAALLDDSWRAAAMAQTGAPATAFDSPDVFASTVPTPSGTMIAQQDLVYSGLVNGALTYTETVDTGSMGTNNTLNQWGDDQTAFVGFTGDTGIASMLIVVGDDDFGDDGNTEHLSFIGATIIPEPSSSMLTFIALFTVLSRRRRR